MIRVETVAGTVTVQDLGWPLGRAMGLPRSGAVDPSALAVANALVGNAEGAAGLEIALGGLTISFDAPAVVALAGSIGGLVIDGKEARPLTTLVVSGSTRLRAETGAEGRFGYVAIRGGIDVPAVLGSRSTYQPVALGGHFGRRLRSDDALTLGNDVGGPAPQPGYAAPPESSEADPRIAVIPGPQIGLFSDDARQVLEREPYQTRPSSDRMGIRLKGPPIRPDRAAELPSEGACIGAIQVPDDGQPIVILPDGPTVGGYPKIGAIATADFARFAQRSTGAEVRFRWVGVAEAQSDLYRADARHRARLAMIRGAART